SPSPSAGSHTRRDECLYLPVQQPASEASTMAMFDKRKDNDRRDQEIPSAPASSFSPSADERPRMPEAPITRGVAMIGKTITIKGDITGEENLVIEGTVDGTV